MGRQMLTLGRGLAERRRVILAAPDAIDARWLFDAAADAGLEAWPLTDGGPGAQAESFRGLLAETTVAVVNVHAGIGWEGHAVAGVARQARAPAIVRTEHLPFLLTKAVDRERYRVGLAAVDAIIAVSGSVARSHIRAGVPEGLVTTVRNGIEDVAPRLRREAVRAALGVPPSAPLVVGVGRMTRQKGWDLLLEAADTILGSGPETTLLIVGSGPLADVIDAEIETRGLSGRVRRRAAWDDVPALLEAADVVALPSRFEGLPLVALEAMAVARPVVGTRVAGIDETVEDGVTGRLVPPEDPAALADAIVEILEDAATARRYGTAGRRRYEDVFTAARMVAETEAVYDRVTSAVDARQDAAPRPIAAGRR
jgi:glycosyltransferase involved in cell wall biosynthesis